MDKNQLKRLAAAGAKIANFGPIIRQQLVRNGNSESDWYNVLEAIRNLLDEQ